METLNFLLQGFDVATRPTNLLVALFGAFVGTVVGLLPGLGPINGVALLLPLAFALGLPPETALILLAAVYLGCEYGGRISAILLNVPGDAAAVMTTLDGYPLARQGKAGIALSLSAVSRFSTPAGMPARTASSAAARAVRGVSSAGLITTGQPAARAGATLRVIIASGKFQGVMAAQTPMGWRSTIRRRLLSNCGRVSPLVRLASSANHSTKLAP